MTTPDPLLTLSRLEGVPSALAAARSAGDAVQRDRGLRRITPETSARALLLGAAANAELGHTEDPGHDWHPGAVRISTELITLAPLIRRAPGQALARLHTLLATGLLPEAELGRPRPESAPRLQGVHQLLTTPTEAPALALAGIVHAELATLAPFVSGNGMVARAAEHLVLIDTGLDPRAALVPEAGHARDADGYRLALADYSAGTAAGVRGWLLQLARAFTAGAELSPLDSR